MVPETTEHPTPTLLGDENWYGTQTRDSQDTAYSHLMHVHVDKLYMMQLSESESLKVSAILSSLQSVSLELLSTVSSVDALDHLLVGDFEL